MDQPGRLGWLRACGAICSLVCCPPLPSRIVAKIAFQAPDPCSYRVDGEGDDQVLFFREMFATGDDFRPFKLSFGATVTNFQATTRRRNTIAGFLIRVPNPRFAILYSHGNAADLGLVAPSMAAMAQELNCNICAYDYSGYGISTGRSKEANLYADIQAIWDCLISRFGITADKILIYGQSIGTVPSVDLASRVQCAGVILHSPLASGLRVLRPHTSCNLWCDPFPSIKKIRHVRSPVLFIHGEMDTLISISHSYALLEECQCPVEPLFLPNAGHNDIELNEEFMDRLVSFILTLDTST